MTSGTNRSYQDPDHRGQRETSCSPFAHAPGPTVTIQQLTAAVAVVAAPVAVAHVARRRPAAPVAVAARRPRRSRHPAVHPLRLPHTHRGRCAATREGARRPSGGSAAATGRATRPLSRRPGGIPPSTLGDTAAPPPHRPTTYRTDCGGLCGKGTVCVWRVHGGNACGARATRGLASRRGGAGGFRCTSGHRRRWASRPRHGRRAWTRAARRRTPPPAGVAAPPP
jgi:hypothetical protein